MTTTAADRPRPRRRRRRINWTARARHLTQAAFVGIILFVSIRHYLVGEVAGGSASIDALCPFGAVETLWRYITTGQFVNKIHPSNLILGFGLFVGVILAGSSFCGWACPFGALQDALNWVRKTLRLPEVHLPERADRIMRYGRYVTLGLILYMTISTAKLWFSGFDPYRTIFSLEWLFEPNLAEHWPAYLIVVLVVAGSLMVPRFWCRYTCPLGGLMSLLGHVSFLRIRRNADGCKSCAICNTSCPVGIDVANADPIVSTNCIGCLACVQSCPRGGALEVQLAPSWLKRDGHVPAEPQTTTGIIG